MKRNTLLLTAALGITGWLMIAPPAMASEHYERYYSYRYYSGRDYHETKRRDIIRERLIHLGDRIRLAELEDCIGPYKARNLFQDLDEVRDFLVHDGYVDRGEFERRMDDLDRVDRRLRDYCGERYVRYYREYDRSSFRYR